MSIARFGLRTRSGQVSGLIQGISTTDADALAFISAAGITDDTQQYAIIALVNDLKTYGLWSKMKAIYPFVGGTASTHKWNLKDPRDLDVAFRLSFSGGWTHSSTGALPNGTTGYADTFYSPSVNSTTSNLSFGFYSRVNSLLAGYTLGGLTSGDFAGVNLGLKLLDSNTYFSANNYVLDGLGNFITDTRGFFVVNKESTGTNGVKMFGNGTQIRQATPTQNLLKNINVVLGARRRDATIELYNSREHSFTYFGDTLTSTEITDLYTVVQAYQTSLARNV
jgi:hypothetical protein